jgi:hypothetical protein
MTFVVFFLDSNTGNLIEYERQDGKLLVTIVNVDTPTRRTTVIDGSGAGCFVVRLLPSGQSAEAHLSSAPLTETHQANSDEPQSHEDEKKKGFLCSMES